MIGTGIGLGVSGFRLPSLNIGSPVFDAFFSTNNSLTPTVGPTPGFSRASTGYAFTSSGVHTSYVIDAPRFHHVYDGTSWISRGLRVEGQVTSNSTNSGVFGGGWTDGNTTRVANAGTAPDGTNTAVRVYPASTGTLRRIYRTMVSSNVHSVFAKAAGKDFLYILNRANTDQAFFNLSTGVVSYTPSSHTAFIEPVGSGWYKCSLYSSGGDYTFVQFGVSDASGSTTATTNSTDGILLASEMCESGTYPTSYILAGGSPTVRSADVCQVTSTNFSDMWNATQGTFVFEGVCPATGTLGLLSVNDSTANERMEIYASGTSAKFIVVDGGATQADITGGSISYGTAFKVAVRYKANDFAISVNGGAAVTDTAGTLPTVTRLQLGVNQAGNYMNGTVSRVRYYTTAYSDSILQGLSI